MKKRKVVINLKNVWKTYKLGEHYVHALRGLNLEVYEGEFLAIRGPSGSGKSTSMNLVGCLDIPSKGIIQLDGINIASLSESDLAQIRGKKIGFIFQKFNLLNNLTAKENVTLPLIFQNIPEEERLDTAERLLTEMGLKDRMNHTPGQLSGGEQQRVAIARALAVDPEVILADEPTGNLDQKTGSKIMDLLKALNRKKGKTVVFVTHDLPLAEYADRIAYLVDGQIVKTKTKQGGKSERAQKTSKNGGK
ncbi:ABC transporter ATP-binding protein [Candidatus Woesearchaeota archaeon]|nr:ABC transporter ATP-binding protein [Candidatus Woesearchaeota archaeon]MBW2994571.1 ABC transporter ATP-binding protein [Candidatus Woesearchaeota archaeon]